MGYVVTLWSASLTASAWAILHASLWQQQQHTYFAFCWCPALWQHRIQEGERFIIRLRFLQLFAMCSSPAPWCSCSVSPPTLQPLAHLGRCDSPRECTLHGSTAYPASASVLIKHHPLTHACFMQSQHCMKPLHSRGRSTCMACSFALKTLGTLVHSMHLCSIRKCTCKYRCAQQMLIAAPALRCDKQATTLSLRLPCLRQQHLRFGCPVSATTSLSYSTTTHRSRLLASASSRCLACSSALEILDAQHGVSPPLILRGRYKVNLANETPNNYMWSREGAASATHSVASCNQHLSV